jgi:hypothetical protein
MARFPSRWSGFPAAAFFWALLSHNHETLREPHFRLLW